MLISLVLWLPMAAEGVYAQTKPKTLKELVAEEKARKEAEKKAKEEEKAKEEARKRREQPTPDPSLKGGEKNQRMIPLQVYGGRIRQIVPNMICSRPMLRKTARIQLRLNLYYGIC